MAKKQRRKVERIPILDAWDKFTKSELGRSAIDPESLKVPMGMEQYLKNRLWRAFMAGAAAQEAIDTAGATRNAK
jgi:hypothetical protein